LVSKGKAVALLKIEHNHLSNFRLKPAVGVRLGEAFSLPLAHRGLAERSADRGRWVELQGRDDVLNTSTLSSC
jgi:hypothetical protein